MLPNKEEIDNEQFVDDTSLIIELSEENITNLTTKLDIFCRALGFKVFIGNSIKLGWKEQPPSWYCKYGFSWGGPTHIVRYLGIPFLVSPNLNLVWEWIKENIINKLNRWNNNYLSLVGRFQVYQKILFV